MVTRAAGSDNFADAPKMDVGDISAYTYTAGKSLEAGEPVGGRSALSRTCWWKLVVKNAGLVTIDTGFSVRASDPHLFADTYLNVWSGTSLTGLTLVASDDDGGPGATSQVTVNLNPGEYYIQVGLYSASTSDARLLLQTTAGSSPLRPDNKFNGGTFAARAPYSSPSASHNTDSPSTTVTVVGRGGANSEILDLADATSTAITPGKTYTIGHSSTPPYPVGGVSRVILSLQFRNSANGSIQQYNMPKGALSNTQVIDSPFYTGFEVVAPAGAAKLFAWSQVEFHKDYNFSSNTGVTLTAFGSLYIREMLVPGTVEPYPDVTPIYINIGDDDTRNMVQLNGPGGMVNLGDDDNRNWVPISQAGGKINVGDDDNRIWVPISEGL